MLLVIKCECFNFLFSLKIRLEIRYNNVLDRKKTFFDYKNKNFESPKYRISPKELTHAFGHKMPLFDFLFSLKIRLEIRYNNVLDRKETFFDYENPNF